MPTCRRGKRCGKACIPRAKNCTKRANYSRPICTTGKRCGNSCINVEYECKKATTGRGRGRASRDEGPFVSSKADEAYDTETESESD